MLDAIMPYLLEHDTLSAFYAANLRASLFAGFLTLSGFLFAVKTFVVVRLQQDVYADEDYQDWILGVARKYNKSITVYGSLRRLGRWLFGSLCAAFAASVAQLTVGLVEQRWSTWLSLGLAAVAATLFLITMLIIRSVIRGWVDYLEDRANKRFAKRGTAAPTAQVTSTQQASAG
jgi:hypothetical protein